MNALVDCVGVARASAIEFDGKLGADSPAEPERGRWGGTRTRVTEQKAASPGDRYEANRQLIDGVINGTARHYRLSADDASEFRSYVWERMLAGNPLARFAQRCSLNTFLTIVIRNYCRDFRNSRWGKWRSSLAARRLGTVALRLETLLARDGHSFEEAVQIIQTNDRSEISRRDLEDIHVRLPRRVRVRLVSDEVLLETAVSSADADATVTRNSQLEKAGQLRRALKSALDRLDPEDRIIIKLIFEEGFTVAQVAGAMHLPQKSLYRRRDELLMRLKAHLEQSGIAPEDVEAAVGGFDADSGAEESARPSTRPTGNARARV